jgi:hypothetical protein
MCTREAIDAAAMSTEAQLSRPYRGAVASGATGTQLTVEDERTYGPLRLLTLALRGLPDLSLCAYLFDTLDDYPDAADISPGVIRAAHDIAAGTLRLAHRALEVHGRDNGYAIDAWLDRAHDQTALELPLVAELTDLEEPAILAEVRFATIALTRAAAATAEDRNLVPEELASGLAHILTIYLIAAHAST